MKHQNTITVFDEAGNAFETELRKGDYKILRNNPSREDGSIHEYCPPEHVSSEMDRLVAFHAQHTEIGVRPEIEAAWLHHAFTQIHPFQDGNGRVARALASLVFIKAGLFPLLVTREDRVPYISALEQADAGNLEQLVKEFSTLQKRLLTKAIGLLPMLRPPRTSTKSST
jgi:Fic family protein